MLNRSLNQYDVIVCGGGPAGLGAAMAAALQGARTLLLEADEVLGGSAVRRMWNGQNRLLLNGGSRGGVHDILVQKLTSYGPIAARPGVTNDKDGDNLNTHPEYFAMSAMEALESCGADYLVNSIVEDVIMDGMRIMGVRVRDGTRERSYTANVIIDATGDGDVAYFAGCEMTRGREYDGLYMAMTVPFTLCNVDTDRFAEASSHNPQLVPEFVRRAELGDYTLSQSYWLYFLGTIEGSVTCNNAGLGASALDGTDSQDLTIVERVGTEIAFDFVRWARDLRLPGFENAQLMRCGTTCIRETRRIVGEYVLNLQDVLSDSNGFEDVIARRYGKIDAVYYSHPMRQGIGYPYRCMLPKQVEGLLVAGRCSSATHLGQASGKSMGNMMEIGQAAGVAAAVCAAQSLLPRQVDVRQVQQRLRDMGVHLEPAEAPGGESKC